jgi:hypothetical protein
MPFSSHILLQLRLPWRPSHQPSFSRRRKSIRQYQTHNIITRVLNTHTVLLSTMMTTSTPNSKPLVVSTPGEASEPWLLTSGAISISTLDMTSKSSDDSEDDDEIHVDTFATFKHVVDVDSLTCDTDTCTETTSEESNTCGDSVASSGSIQEKEPLPSKFRGIRSSIKLASLQGEIPVHTRRSSWKQLPIPDMSKIRRVQTLPTSLNEAEETSAQRRPSVTFQNVCIRRYEQTVGDNPSVSYGPPISLDWGFQELNPVPVDDYEENRGDRRPFKQMGLNYFQRMAILQNGFGHSEADLKEAMRKANSDKFKRAVTKYFLPVQVLEDAAESGVRKTKRYLQRRRQSTV